MTKTKYYIFFISLFSTSAFAQNLVLDPSFENFDSTFTSSWKNLKISMPFGTPDLSIKGNSRTLTWGGFPAEKCQLGERCVGCGLYIHGHEAFGVLLKKPLVKDAIYEVKMYVKKLKNENYLSKKDNLVVGFSKDTISWLNCKQNKISFVALQSNASNVYEWHLIEGKYKAKGGEQYVLINNPIDREPSNNEGTFGAYFYFDDLSVTLSKETKIEEEIKPILFPTNEVFRASALYFESNKYVIASNSYSYLEQVAKHLQTNPTLQIGINAHTDNQGNDLNNQTLSEQRAKSVADYLLSKGISQERIISKGFGKSQPIASNENEQGRQQNRRVEFLFQEMPLSKLQLDVITDFAKVYGYLRFFHPSDIDTVIDWNKFAYYGVEKLSNVKTKEEAQLNLQKLIKIIAPSTQFALSKKQLPALQPVKNYNKDMVFWQHEGLQNPRAVYTSIRTNRTKKLPNWTDRTLKEGKIFEAIPPYYTLSDSTKIGIYYNLPVVLTTKTCTYNALIFNNLQKELKEVNDYSSRTKNIGDALIFWNLMAHFNPYLQEVRPDWQTYLEPLIKQISGITEELEYRNTMKKLIATFNDSHAFFINNAESKEMWLPIEKGLVENKIVATKATKGLNIKQGDIILGIDDKNALESYKNLLPLISGSSQWKKEQALMSLGVGKQYSTSKVKIQRKDSIFTLELKRDWAEYKQSLAPFQEIKEKIYYINLTQISKDSLHKVIPTLVNSKGLVLDLRGYVADDYEELFMHLTSVSDTCRWINTPFYVYPNQKYVTFEKSGVAYTPKKPSINPQNVVFLTNANAISASETHLELVKHYKLGLIVGEATAGANGSANNYRFASGYTMRWTGMYVTMPNGDRLYNKGITPDIEVKPTLKGLQEGRDELLEKALELLER